MWERVLRVRVNPFVQGHKGNLWQSITASPLSYCVSLQWHFLPPAADSPTALPSYPLFMCGCRLQVGVLQSSKGDIWQFPGKYHGVCFSVHLQKSISFWTLYMELIFHPKEREHRALRPQWETSRTTLPRKKFQVIKQDTKHLIQPFFCYTWLMIFNIFFSRK